MKITRTRFIRTAPLLFLLMGAAYLPGNANEPSAWRIAMDHIGLLPETDSPYGSPGAKHLSDQIGREFSEDELKLLGRDATGAWKTHDDGFIRFDLPDNPLLKVEPFEPEQRPNLEIVGGAVGSTDNSFRKVYRITFADGVPYGLIFVSNADWFDEGICMCGPIDLKTFVNDEGNLVELSQLPDGAIKKSQVINGKHRAILFEWTHSAITQHAYARIAASVRFVEKSPHSREDWIAISREKRAFEAGLGWLVPGTNVDEALALLGEPTKRAGNTLTYCREERDEDGSGYSMTHTLDFPAGKLARFAEGWETYEDLKAIRGSQAWIRDTIRGWSGESDDVFSDAKPKPKEKAKEDIDMILSQFHSKAPTATGDDWEYWTGVLADLKRAGISDAKALGLVSLRASDMSLPHHQTRWILELYEHPYADDFTVRRLRFLIEGAEGAGDHIGETHNLFAGLNVERQGSADLLREGMSHPNKTIREAAVYFVDKLPREEARSILKLALVDEDPDTRRAAILNLRDLCDSKDIPWLEKILEQETDESNRELLKEKMESF